ncbi:excinuclease ABC subunit UvrC [Roseivirga pacifica]|uniref:excinuclease ABC subunit UvrC n=1 Tax=Roseivirga pacifica TaxID=1267423 RepID=UPI00209531E6|nr:excinuclease ABC subunit UvrC [Roseivirga pacifica]MCO6359382.1 excinuclease ABC subunit C [Roseivirga pacifica]MCO6366752.1 excinuclease ABC subunit C [Roseivirga pacifica]MCO6370716.1 excinuclease ABC subunit C [Roseivirga pacifica]MCO6374408.1 excinuclease ABC subunit C [Roseivirga pacifica]MCO6379667.1 excinuclease ABC subunit C [Roseivirga pacifica]
MEAARFSTKEISKLPDQPGVYRYFNADDVLIYVGKAKSLKKRVSSYFNKLSGNSRKTRRLVSEIKAIEVTLVNSEFDALLLENNLIKQNQPKYNILLKDDKTFPYICVSNERFPRIYSTRKLIPSLGTYFGPFANVKAMNNVLRLINSLFTLRTCRYDLSEDNIQKEKYKVCLEYHIGNCKGPCEALQTEADYLKDVDQAVHILKGNLSLPKSFFKEAMQEAAANLEFEQAQKFKDKLELVDKFQSKSIVVSPKLADIDVFSIISDEKFAFVNYLRIKNGTINLSITHEVKKKLNEADEDVLSLVMVQMRDKYQSEAREVLTNVALDFPADNFKVSVPQIGDKKKLIQLSLKNSLFAKKEKYESLENVKDKGNRVLKQLQADLQLKELPTHIECFDNSNIQGTNPVASMVCFKMGRPSKKDYRHFKIKTVVGPDDFGSMTEVVGRRYKRMVEEKQPLPKLIVIDGGKGQLNAACDALKALDLYGVIPIIGIAKRLEELYFPEDSFPLHIDKKSESLRLIQQLRDEAHRFAITFHRDLRSKNSFNFELENVKGVGRVTVDQLLKHFRTMSKIEAASEDQIAAIVGASRARLIKTYFQQKKEAN